MGWTQLNGLFSYLTWGHSFWLQLTGNLTGARWFEMASLTYLVVVDWLLAGWSGGLQPGQLGHMVFHAPRVWSSSHGSFKAILQEGKNNCWQVSWGRPRLGSHNQHLHHILLVQATDRDSSNSRCGEIFSTSWWKRLQSHIVKGYCACKIGRNFYGSLCKQSTINT